MQDTVVEAWHAHEASVENMLGLQGVVGEFPFPHAEEDEDAASTNKHGDHGGYKDGERRLLRVGHDLRLS